MYVHPSMWKPSLKLTVRTLKVDGWKISFLLGPGRFSGAMLLVVGRVTVCPHIHPWMFGRSCPHLFGGRWLKNQGHDMFSKLWVSLLARTKKFHLQFWENVPFLGWWAKTWPELRGLVVGDLQGSGITRSRSRRLCFIRLLNFAMKKIVPWNCGWNQIPTKTLRSKFHFFTVMVNLEPQSAQVTDSPPISSSPS